MGDETKENGKKTCFTTQYIRHIHSLFFLYFILLLAFLQCMQWIYTDMYTNWTLSLVYNYFFSSFKHVTLTLDKAILGGKWPHEINYVEQMFNSSKLTLEEKQKLIKLIMAIETMCIFKILWLIDTLYQVFKQTSLEASH